MKKTILAGAGVIGACAACCAIPILVPLASGFSVAALTAAGFGVPDSAGVPFLLAVGTIGAVASGLAWRAARDRKGAASCGTQAAGTCGSKDGSASEGCGCSAQSASGSAVR